MFIVSELSNMGAWNQMFCDPKTQPSRKWCVLVHHLFGKCKSQSYPHKCAEVIVLGIFAVVMVKLQQFVISETDEVHHRSSVAIQQVCQHCLRQASLYSQHVMTSALHHD